VPPPGQGHFWVHTWPCPYSQPCSLDGSSNVASSFTSTVTTCRLMSRVGGILLYSSSDIGGPKSATMNTHTCLMAFFSGTSTQVSQCRKSKTFTEARGTGISWAVYESAPRFRQITTTAPHHSVFLQAGCPCCCPTNSVKALKVYQPATIKNT